jgi:hypothetical protein
LDLDHLYLALLVLVVKVAPRSPSFPAAGEGQVCQSVGTTATGMAGLAQSPGH